MFALLLLAAIISPPDVAMPSEEPADCRQAACGTVEMPAEEDMPSYPMTPGAIAYSQTRAAEESKLLRVRIGDFQECVLTSGRLLARATREPAEIVASASFGRCSGVASMLSSQAFIAASVPVEEFMANARAAILDELYATILSERAGATAHVIPKM